jgi:predicted DNA-binding mobile mystery protein A
MKIEIQNLILTGLDTRLGTLQLARTRAEKPARGWLRAVRTALGLKQQSVAKKLSMTRQAYAGLEAAEERSAISLTSLERAAQAMDCELVYFLLPREQVARTFSELAQLHDPAFKHLQASEHSMALENQAVGDLPPKPKP